jgi:glycosyltransferase involved in cell wall biosynthesis
VKKLIYMCFQLGNPDVDRCNALADGGYRVTVYNWIPEQGEYIWDKSLERRFEVVDVKVQSLRSPFSWCRGVFAIVADVAFFRRADICIVYGYQRPSYFLIAAALRLLGCKILSMNDSKFDDYGRFLFKELVKWIALLPYSGFLAASDRAKSYLEFFGKTNIKLYYCAISLERVSLNPNGNLVEFADRHFTVIARFVPKKNFPLLLSAYERYAASTKMPRRLVLCGYGPLESQIQAIIGNSELLIKNVEIKGYVDSDGVKDVLRTSLALMLPSMGEQFGIVVTESLACGVPVILSENCGATDLIKSGVNGFKHEPDNSEGLAFYMQLLASDEDLWKQMSAAAPPSATVADVHQFVQAVAELSCGPALEARQKGN